MKSYIKKLGVLALTLVNIGLAFTVHKLTLQLDVLQSNYKDLQTTQWEWNQAHAGRMNRFFGELIDLYNKKAADGTNDIVLLPPPSAYYGSMYKFDDTRPQP